MSASIPVFVNLKALLARLNHYSDTDQPEMARELERQIWRLALEAIADREVVTAVEQGALATLALRSLEVEFPRSDD